jgi:hypothetical protein
MPASDDYLHQFTHLLAMLLCGPFSLMHKVPQLQLGGGGRSAFFVMGALLLAQIPCKNQSTLYYQPKRVEIQWMQSDEQSNFQNCFPSPLANRVWGLQYLIDN